ncbi:hypothetical protein CGZ80_21515 [Rhodopirellula sp. MGV]|nr:hypothetical protein CGZ80_21515 [Rhodopirellula sp. MGV]PNY36007.1 hypothetical protein C2E31_14905 [Rhodopirellula baltica]
MQRRLPHLPCAPAFFAAWFLAIYGVGWVSLNHAVAQSPSEQSPAGITIIPSMVQRASSNHWTPLKVVAVNRGSQDRNELISVYVDGEPKVQFAADVWVPAGSQRQAWVPVLVPPQTEVGRVNIPITSMMLQSGPDGETLRPDWTDAATIKRSLLLTEDEINTGLISDPPTIDLDGTEVYRIDHLTKLIDVGRTSAIQNSMELPNIAFNANFLPDTHGALDQLDQIVIAGNSLRHDTAGLLAVRRWLRRGGRLWIMLDQTDEDIVRDLLGDDAVFDIGDSTMLNQFELQSFNAVGSNDAVSETWESESPVEFVRVFTSSEDISSSIDGWPAAFWQSVGDGEVLFTTLGGEGWLNSQRGPMNGFTYFSRRLFEPHVEPFDSVAAMAPLVNEQIGYQVPSRSTAAFMMITNTVLIAAGGLWWMRMKRLERLAILIPAVALLTGGAMLWIGKSNSGSIPTTIASGQLVVINEATQEADIQSTYAVYCQDETPVELSSKADIFVQPLEWASNRTKRAQWSGSGENRWIQPEQPPGTVENWFSNTSMFVTNSTNTSDIGSMPTMLTGSFNETGFVGNLEHASSMKLEDAFLASFPAPSCSAKVAMSDKDAAITVGPDAVLTAGQFVDATLLDDTQTRRQALLRQLFESGEQSFLKDGVQLMFWSDPQDIGIGVSEAFDRIGTSLVSIPVKLRAPEPGTRVRIPATFIKTESFTKSRGMSSLFNPRNGQWLTDVTKSTETDLLFRLPPELGDVAITRVNVSMRIAAPERTVAIKAVHGDQSTTVFEIDSPTGLQSFSIDDESVLDASINGGIVLTLSVSSPIDGAPEAADSVVISQQTPQTNVPHPIVGEIETTNKTWQVDSFIIDVEGVAK